MKSARLPLLCALLALGGAASGAAVRPADDVRVALRIADGATAGPLARITVRNLGTNAQAGVEVRVFAENEGGLELWSGTVDLAPGAAALRTERVWLDADTTALVATATLAGAVDEDPTDNASRAALGLRGRRARAVVGRSIHLARCASCHGDDGAGGTGPSIVGAPSARVLEVAAAGGDHDFPWISRADAHHLGAFLSDPAGVVLPPPLPTPPPGGWPVYSGELKTLLDDRCVQCHGAGRAEAGIRVHTYETTSKNARRALVAVKSGRMPNGGKRFSPSEVGLIQDWIDGGRRP